MRGKHRNVSIKIIFIETNDKLSAMLNQLSTTQQQPKLNYNYNPAARLQMRNLQLQLQLQRRKNTINCVLNQTNLVNL